MLYANAEGLGREDLDESAVRGPRSAGLTDLDRWALSRLHATIAEVIERMESFDCTGGGRAIAAYVDELSNWYVRLSRRRFWEGDRAALATLRHCLVEAAKLAAPFVPFLADELYDNLTGEGGVTHRAWQLGGDTPIGSWKPRWRQFAGPWSSAAPLAPGPE